jgi:hypothetical protein
MSRKHDNFVRLAEARVNKALESIRIVGNLSNKNNYEYSPEEAREILVALQAGVNDLKAQFNRSDEDETVFRFKMKMGK